MYDIYGFRNCAKAVCMYVPWRTLLMVALRRPKTTILRQARGKWELQVYCTRMFLRKSDVRTKCSSVMRPSKTNECMRAALSL